MVLSWSKPLCPKHLERRSCFARRGLLHKTRGRYVVQELQKSTKRIEDQAIEPGRR